MNHEYNNIQLLNGIQDNQGQSIRVVSRGQVTLTDLDCSEYPKKQIFGQHTLSTVPVER